MRAQVQTDTTRRTRRTRRTVIVEIKVGPVQDITQRWHKEPRKIQVDRLTLNFIDDGLTEIKVGGRIIPKNGVPSGSVRDDWSWYEWNRTLGQAPYWVHKIIKDVQLGSARERTFDLPV